METNEGQLLRLKRYLEKAKETGGILRRLFLNTLFDSTFTQIGIIVGSALSSPNPDIRLIMGTLVTSSVALGISTGVSVYESETMERERKILKLERALFRELQDTVLTQDYRTYAIILSVVNFFTPLICCGILIMPLVLASLGVIDIIAAAWCSIFLGLMILFIAGTYLGRMGRGNALVKGLRMVIFGGIAFGIGFLIQRII